MKATPIDQGDFFDLLEKATRGRLKIYTGPVAGVGKTYRMLEEAHTLQARGADVVIAYIETHGRQRLEELLTGLDIIPRKKYEYKGVILEEMDLDAVLKRKPQIAIVDEVAHTNAPLCRNQKRYQDIIELLRAGINVICALNIQHLESLVDVIKKFTGVTIYETVPDSFLKYADQVINVDLGVEDIIQRLETGQIYSEDKITIALKNFFKEENLTKLREIALREVAEIIEQAAPPATLQSFKLKDALFMSNQIMVCFSPQKFSQKTLFKKVARLAGRMNREWFLVFAETPHDEPERIDLEKQRYLFSDIQFAKDLGAHIVHLKTNNRVEAWTEFAKKENIAQIVIGRIQDNWWRTLFGIDTIQSLIRETATHDLIILSYYSKITDEEIL